MRSHLNPYQALFHPAPSSSINLSGEPVIRQSSQRLGSYDGSIPWEAYQIQFEMLAHINRWSNEEKATYLAVSLKGPALTVLSNLPVDSLYCYDRLVGALNRKFGTQHQAELFRVQFKTRTLRRDEDLPALAEDVKRLAHLAYPDTPRHTQYFVEGPVY